MTYWDDLVPCKPGDIVRLHNGTTTRILGIESHFGDTTLRVEYEFRGRRWPVHAELHDVAEVVGHKPLYDFTPAELEAARTVAQAVARVRQGMPWVTVAEARQQLEAKAKENHD
jgi:hypothetical protein